MYRMGRMDSVAFVYHPDYLKHDTGEHPERPERVEAIARAVERAAYPGVQLVTPLPASLEQVLRVHTRQHVERLRQVAAAGGGYVTPDTVLSPDSYDVALLAAGGAIRAVEAVLAGERVAYALCRPPGHHAGPALFGGYWLVIGPFSAWIRRMFLAAASRRAEAGAVPGDGKRRRRR